MGRETILRSYQREKEDKGRNRRIGRREKKYRKKEKV